MCENFEHTITFPSLSRHENCEVWVLSSWAKYVCSNSVYKAVLLFWTEMFPLHVISNDNYFQNSIELQSALITIYNYAIRYLLRPIIIGDCGSCVGKCLSTQHLYLKIVSCKQMVCRTTHTFRFGNLKLTERWRSK